MSRDECAVKLLSVPLNSEAGLLYARHMKNVMAAALPSPRYHKGLDHVEGTVPYPKNCSPASPDSKSVLVWYSDSSPAIT
jgi:hypothetical protein